MNVRLLVLLALASSCARAPGPPSSESRMTGVSPTAPSALAISAGSAASPVAASSPSSTAVAAVSDARAPTRGELAPQAGGAATELPLEGEDFTPQARTLFRVAACGSGAEESPSRFDAAVVSRHCDELGRAYRDYQKAWVDVARPFIASLRPKDLPHTIVYPFGGGDLASALATFPDATETTTISLEPSGDIRPIDVLAPERLAHELAEHRSHLERLFEKAHSRTDNLEKESKTELPGEIVFALAALAVYGDEPVALRYFRIGPDGAIIYVTRAELEGSHTGPERRALFANAEIRFRRSGVAEPPVKVFRHISFNLDDSHLRSDPSLLGYLNGRGPVAAMTKAASHLLWNDQFSQMRGWLLGHAEWMISDSTGIPPRFAAPAGFVQDTYGTFNGPAPFGLLNPRDAADFRKLFASEPARELAFRYGYPDRDGHGHLIVMRRGPTGPETVDSGR